MKTVKAFFLGIVMLMVVATVHVKAQPSDQPPSDQPLVIADQGLGFSLTLPGDLAVGLPAEFEGVNIVQIVPVGAVDESDDTHVPPTKVEISAERIGDDMSYEEWQEVNQILLVGFGYDVQELSATTTEVNGVPATYRELSSPEGIIRETEIFKNQTVYRVYGLVGDKIGVIYQAVLDGLVFSEANALPVNDLPSLMELQSETSLAPDAPEAMPNLKLPYSGTKTITCAYYADNHNCHALSKIALDFNLNYEPVRATYSGRSYQISDSCGGKMAKLIYTADTRYATFYLHLNRHFVGLSIKVITLRSLELLVPA